MAWLFGRRRAAVTGQLPGDVGTEGERRDYIFGESEGEISRLNFQHYMFRYAFEGDFSAPVRSPIDILDVACGTGRWARRGSSVSWRQGYRLRHQS